MSVAAVESLWKTIEARSWDDVRRFYSETAEMVWPVSGEFISGRNGIVAVNENYPEGWSIQILAIDELADGRIVSRVKVEQASKVFFAVSFFTFTRGLIRHIEEYWATQEEPEPWRNAEVIPGWSRLLGQL